MVNVGLDHRAVGSQLAPTSDLQATSQGNDMVEQTVQGLRLNQVRPANERRIVGHRLEVDAAELPERETISDERLRLFVAPAVQVLGD
jgi:hypothetical protein